MESVLLLLTLLALVKATLSGSLLPRRWQRLTFGALYAASLWVFRPYALEFNKLQVESALSEPQALTNLSLVVMLDLLVTCAACRACLAPQRALRRLRYLPSLLLFPALFYVQVDLFFTFAGQAFTTLTLWLSIGIFVLLSGGGYLWRRWFPSDESRIELTLLCGVLIFALTVCCTVFHPSATVVSHSTPIDWRGTGLALSVTTLLLAAGYLAPRFLKKLKKQHN